MEEDASAQQLSEDAAYGPDIDGVGVVAAPHQDLWSSVVLRHHFLSHVPRFVRFLHSGQAEITDLKGGQEEIFILSFLHCAADAPIKLRHISLTTVTSKDPNP